MPKVELTANELELLKKALPYAQKLGEQGEELVQDNLRDFLECSRHSAKNLQHYIIENELVKVAGRLQAIPERAETRAVANYAVDVPTGTSYSHVVRENIALRKQLAKLKFEQEAKSAAREQAARAEIEAMIEYAKQIRPNSLPVIRPEKKSGNILLINIPDAHFGKLAWGIETGGRPYDVKIAIEIYSKAARTVVSRAVAMGIKFDEIIYIIGNDILNSNDAENKTAHGTIVTTDGRYHKTFRKLRETITDLVEEFRQVAPVRIIPVYGNHDTLSAWHLGDSLLSWFHTYKDVTVENEPTYRKYHLYGNTMFMWTHGDKGQRDDFPLLMAIEHPEMWSKAIFRECQTGHNHKTKVDEYHGVRVRILPALCPADDWHSENGYVGSLRSAEGQIVNEKAGTIAMVYYNDDAEPVTKTQREIVNKGASQAV
jgi:hypothetical protein